MMFQTTSGLLFLDLILEMQLKLDSVIIKELSMLNTWTIGHLVKMARKKKPFKLNIFGIFGIFVLSLGMGSIFIFYYYMKEIYFSGIIKTS